MELEQSVEETVEEADNSLKSMPSNVGSSMPAATGEVEKPVSSEPLSKAAVDVKSRARLTPKPSADLPASRSSPSEQQSRRRRATLSLCDSVWWCRPREPPSKGLYPN